MASDSDAAETQSILERLITSRNRSLSFFIPFILGLNSFDPDQDSPDLDQESLGLDTPNPEPESQRDRIMLINPLTQGMIVIEGPDLSFLLQGMHKAGPPPASKAAIESMPSVEISKGDEDGECVICLEDWEIGAVAKEIPCKHRFHGGCIEKWLGIHGSCPVCRYRMPVEEESEGKKREESEGERRGEREIWVSFSFGGRRRRMSGEADGDSDRSSSGDDEQPTSID